MPHSILLIAFAFFFTSCQSTKEVWHTTEELKQPESALYSEAHKVIFVSNINGEPLAQDGNGYISMFNVSGRSLANRWIEGLNAPKGMAVFGAYLYVTDIDELVVINIDRSMIEKKVAIPGARFLNDVAAAPNGDIYFSDMMDDAIYTFKNGILEVFVKDSALEAPNGLTIKDGKLYVATWGILKEGFATSKAGRILSIDLTTRKIEPFISNDPIGNLDGLEFTKDGFFVSDWMRGIVFSGSSSGKTTQILDLGQGAADIGIIHKDRLLLVPHMMKNELRAYKF